MKKLVHSSVFALIMRYDISFPSLLNTQVQPESHCSNVTTFGSYGCRSDDGQMCVYLKDIEPLGGFLSFDNAGVASIAVFLLMLQENLSSMVNSTVDSFGEIAGISLSVQFFSIV